MIRPNSLSRRTALRTLLGVPLLGLASTRAAAGVDPAAVFADAATPELGNSHGDVTIAVYFDYQCPFCKKTEPELMKVVEADGHVRIVLKDWPIFGPASVEMARRVWSTGRQNLLPRAHDAVLATRGRPDAARLDGILASVGVDLARLARDVKVDADTFDALLARNAEQAEGFGFPGTPAYVVGTFVFPGVLDADGFRQAIADVRHARAG